MLKTQIRVTRPLLCVTLLSANNGLMFHSIRLPFFDILKHMCSPQASPYQIMWPSCMLTLASPVVGHGISNCVTRTTPGTPTTNYWNAVLIKICKYNKRLQFYTMNKTSHTYTLMPSIAAINM